MKLLSPRSMWAAMIAAVGLVFGLAYADLRRDQAHALDELCAQQEDLARVLAALVEARLPALARPLEAAAPGDRARLVEGLVPAEVLGEPDSARWLLREPSGHVVELAPAGSGHAPLELPGQPTPDLARLLAALTAGHVGWTVLDRPSAASLGLERRLAIAGFAPVRLGAERGWSVAAVASASRVRDRARIGALRLAAATGLAALLSAVFGLFISRQHERARSLAEALVRAEETARLRQSLERAGKLATIGTLAAGVAHEVGTPLGIISGRAEALAERLERLGDSREREPMRKALTSIVAQVEKVSRTIRQLLDFSRVRPPVEATRVQPGPLVESARGLLEHRFRQAEVALSVELERALPEVRGDAGQLEQVLVNLLMNAVDACRPGGQVRVRAHAAGARLALEIEDDGAGIAAEHLPHVLDPFFTTKKRGQGTGLGLTIVADIVRNHGGELAIDSTPGRGTCVRVELPRASGET